MNHIKKKFLFYIKPKTNLFISFQLFTHLPDGRVWLQEQIDMDWKETKVSIPLRSDGNEYSIFDLKDDQEQVAAFILKQIQTYCEDPENFKPVRMTIIGLAGSGKTFVENTLVSIVRNFLNSTTSVQIVAPTGAAAFNAGGSTLHYKF